MFNRRNIASLALASLSLSTVTACSGNSGLGSVLGSVLGGSQQSQQGQVSGSIRGVDTRNQQISIQQSNGQSVALGYDNQTKVVYQNQNYSVTNLEYGDQVTARVQSNTNGAYYTDLVQVDQSVQNSTGSTSGNVQSVGGTVRSVDLQNGLFQITSSNNVVLTVTMPYNPSRNDALKFQSLRNGDVVRIAGVFVNNARVELRQFY